MDPQKGKSWIGDRIDQVANQRIAAGAKLIVFTAERDYASLARFASKGGYAIAMQSGAIYEKIAAIPTGGRFHLPAAGCALQADHDTGGAELASCQTHDLNHFLHDPAIID